MRMVEIRLEIRKIIKELQTHATKVDYSYNPEVKILLKKLSTLKTQMANKNV